MKQTEFAFIVGGIVIAVVILLLAGNQLGVDLSASVSPDVCYADPCAKLPEDDPLLDTCEPSVISCTDPNCDVGACKVPL